MVDLVTMMMGGRLDEVPSVGEGGPNEPGGRMGLNEQNNRSCMMVPNRRRDMLIQMRGKNCG